MAKMSNPSIPAPCRAYRSAIRARIEVVRVSHKRSLNVAIIGAGMSGLCMAAKLQDAGIDTFTIFEQADEVGGTWRDDTYPGLSCDVPSRFYSYTFPA
jgi:cation diffusion facilitator CzcD-associated flavoprotein CzcO